MSLCVLVHKPSSLRFESFETEEILILKKKYMILKLILINKLFLNLGTSCFFL